MTPSIKIHDEHVPITAEPSVNVEAALGCVPFKDWAASLDHRFHVKSIHLQSLDMFGKHVGFLKFKCDVVERSSGRFLPGIVFMRGGAVGILVSLVCGAKRYALICRQPRISIGRASYAEIPAGMLDGSGNFAGVAAKEMEEETGIVINQQKLVDLTALVYGERFRGMYPSPGGCDEFIRLYYFEHAVTEEELKQLEGKHTGNLSEGEVITLQVLPIDDLISVSPDAKTLAAMALYSHARDKGLL